MHEPAKDTQEGEMIEVLRNPKEWVWPQCTKGLHDTQENVLFFIKEWLFDQISRSFIVFKQLI